MEIELKFTFPRERRADIDAILEAKGLARGAQARRVVTVYFDTPGLALAAAGFSLRVRHRGRSNVQTLKSLDDGAAFRRFEQEWTIAGKTPDLALLAPTPAARPLAGHSPADLVPLFSTHIHRTAMPIVLDDGNEIELAIDDGEIRAGAAILPVHELELELKHGRVGALYGFARALTADLPLTIAVASKAERGFRLRSGQSPRPRKAKPVALTAAVAAPQAMGAIVESGLAQLIANLDAVSPTGDGEGVHQARVAIRRLRSALVLFDGYLEPRAAARFERQLWDYGRVLGAARDWDVFMLETLPRAKAAGMEDAWLDRLAPLADARRHDAYAAVARLIASPRPTAFALALAGWVAGGSWAKGGKMGDRILAADVAEIAPELLERLRHKVLRRARHVEEQSLDQLHALRKAFKKLRYAVEFFGGLYESKAVKHYRHACEGLQEILGAINDTAATEMLLGRIGEGVENARLAPSIAVLERWSQHNRRDALARLPAAWHGFRDEAPFWR
jgi:inorganic triphosphatase YgiF